MDVDKINEKLKNIGMRERCLELTQELATVKERAEKAEARVKELEDSHKKLLDGISEDCAKMRSILGNDWPTQSNKS